MLFVYAILTSVGGMTIAAVRDGAPAINIPAGLLTSYLVITSLTTLRPWLLVKGVNVETWKLQAGAPAAIPT